MRTLLGTVLLLAVMGCGGDDSPGATATSTTEARSTTTVNPDEEFLTQIDDKGLRHGYTDEQLTAQADKICDGARQDSTSPTDTRPGTSHVSSAVAFLYIGTDETPYPMEPEDAREIGLLVGKLYCPEFNAEISRGADLAVDQS